MYDYSIWWFWVSFIIIDIEIIVVITIVVFRGPSSWSKPSRIIETGIVSMPVISVTSNSSERINSVFTRLDILLTNEPLQILVLYKTRMQGIVVAYSRGDYWGAFGAFVRPKTSSFQILNTWLWVHSLWHLAHIIVLIFSFWFWVRFLLLFSCYHIIIIKISL